jgi:hypothetical protein
VQSSSDGSSSHPSTVDIDEDHVRLNGHFDLKPWKIRESFSQPVGVVMILRQAVDVVLQSVESGGR